MSEDYKGSSPKHDRVVDLYFQTLHIESISHVLSFPEWKYTPFPPKTDKKGPGIFNPVQVNFGSLAVDCLFLRYPPM